VEVIPLRNYPEGAMANIYVILDGHSDPSCAVYTHKHLPSRLVNAITSLPIEAWTSPFSHKDAVADCLANQLKAFDDHLCDEFLSIFPGGLDGLAALSDGAIHQLVNEDVENNNKVRRFGAGSTALVTLQVGRDFWTANVGDCKATLGFKEMGATGWNTRIISDRPHNARSNPEEKYKVERDHSAEPDVMKGDRVLGLIAVTRGG
jgi:pyruvate dehydrogenase phosphatase